MANIAGNNCRFAALSGCCPGSTLYWQGMQEEGKLAWLLLIVVYAALAFIPENRIMTYAIRAVAELNANIEASAVTCKESVIKFKSKEKKGYFVVLPELTENSVMSFLNCKGGMEAAKDWMDSLRKEAAKKRFDSSQSFSFADIQNEALIQIAAAVSENVRLTKENIEKGFESWKHTIAYGLVLERDAAGAAILLGEDMNAKAAFWNSEAGLKMMQLAGNYLQFFLKGSERKPTFEKQAVKDKVIWAVELLDQEEQLVQKLVEKLKDAPIASADDIAL
jgi:hypothetical protein